MIADSKRLLTAELHVARENIDRLLTVTVGELVAEFIARHLLPNAVLVLDVSRADLVDVDLAEIVQKRDDGDALLGIAESELILDSCAVEIAVQAIVDVQAVLEKSALIIAMKACRRGCRKEIALFGIGQKFEQLICAFSFDFGFVNFQKFLVVGHKDTPILWRSYGKNRPYLF